METIPWLTWEDMEVLNFDYREVSFRFLFLMELLLSIFDNSYFFFKHSVPRLDHDFREIVIIIQ